MGPVHWAWVQGASRDLLAGLGPALQASLVPLVQPLLVGLGVGL
jgi:hypothetical protein